MHKKTLNQKISEFGFARCRGRFGTFTSRGPACKANAGNGRCVSGLAGKEKLTFTSCLRCRLHCRPTNRPSKLGRRTASISGKLGERNEITTGRMEHRALTACPDMEGTILGFFVGGSRGSSDSYRRWGGRLAIRRPERFGV
jgi:hypothetical protein